MDGLNASAAVVPAPPGAAPIQPGVPVVRRWLPNTLFGRLALLLVAAVVASHVLALTLLFELRPDHGPRPDHAAWQQRDGAPAGAGGAPHAMSPPPRMPPMPLLHPGLLLDIGVRLLALIAAAWIGARWLAEPLGRFARAARELGVDIHRPPLVEAGTAECREAARVVNQMQARICQQLDDRDRFVAAVSHDLRTPLTRLRLRTEGLDDPEQRRRFGLDIDAMDAMIRATLDYMRGTAPAEAMVVVDTQALLHSLADDQQACGHAVELRGHGGPIRADAVALRRALDNLVENAIRYGGGAEIHVFDDATALCIEVRDEGPGLPEQELERVLQPFYRVDASRHRDHGGVGLGLSIAHDIARKHGGTLSLRNGHGAGLVASLRLPRSGPA